MQAAAPAFPAVVEELADLDAGGDQLVPGGLDVGNDQECLGRTGSGRRDVLAEMDRAGGAQRRELDQAEIFGGGAVNVEPPSDPLVKRPRAIDIRNGDDDDLELHVNPRDARVSCCVVTMDFIGAHQLPPVFCEGSPSRFYPRRNEAAEHFSNDLNLRWAAFRA